MFLRRIRRKILGGKILKQAMKDESKFSGMGETRTIWDTFDEMDKKEERINKIGKFPDTKKVLSEHDRKPEEIFEIYRDLLKSRLGIFNSAVIIINPEYLNLYLTKKKEGLSSGEVTIFLLNHIEELV